MHSHNYKKEDWPFNFEDDKLVVTTKFVMAGEQPIVEVLHYDEGDWQFMCNTTEDPEDGMLVCIGCLFEKHPWIKQFGDLGSGYLSYLDDGSWEIEKID